MYLQVHRGLMSLTVLLTAVGFIFPFVYRQKWSSVSQVYAVCQYCPKNYLELKWIS